MVLNVAFNYSSRSEIVDAVQAYVDEGNPVATLDELDGVIVAADFASSDYHATLYFSSCGVVGALLVCFLATVYPALGAARLEVALDPVALANYKDALDKPAGQLTGATLSSIRTSVLFTICGCWPSQRRAGLP